MKHSLKYAKNAKWWFLAIATAVVVLRILSIWGELTVQTIPGLVLLFALLVFTTMGVEGFALMMGTNFHREVNNPVDLDKLIEGQICWLNGQTQVKFVKKDENYGGYRFQIWGRDDFNDPNDHTRLAPWQVRTYISYNQED